MNGKEIPLEDFIRAVLAILADEEFNPRPHPEIIPESPPEPEQQASQPLGERIMSGNTTQDQTENAKPADGAPAQPGWFSKAWNATKPTAKVVGWIFVGIAGTIAGQQGYSKFKGNKTNTGS